MVSVRSQLFASRCSYLHRTDLRTDTFLVSIPTFSLSSQASILTAVCRLAVRPVAGSAAPQVRNAPGVRKQRRRIYRCGNAASAGDAITCRISVCSRRRLFLLKDSACTLRKSDFTEVHESAGKNMVSNLDIYPLEFSQHTYMSR